MSSFGFEKIKERMEQLKRELPPVIGNMGQRFFVSNFDNQSWTDSAPEPWEDVKRREPGTLAYKYPQKKDLSRHNRPILVGKSSGGQHLRQQVNRSLKSASFHEILFVISGPYARVHNEGLKAGRGGGFIMPKRQYIGMSHKLTADIKQKVKEKMSQVLKP